MTGKRNVYLNMKTRKEARGTASGIGLPDQFDSITVNRNQCLLINASNSGSAMELFSQRITFDNGVRRDLRNLDAVMQLAISLDDTLRNRNMKDGFAVK